MHAVFVKWKASSAVFLWTNIWERRSLTMTWIIDRLFITRFRRFVAESVSSHGFTATSEAVCCQGPGKRLSLSLRCFQFQYCPDTDLTRVTFNLLYCLNDAFLWVVSRKQYQIYAGIVQLKGGDVYAVPVSGPSSLPTPVSGGPG